MLTDLKLKRYKCTPGKREILWDRNGLGLLTGARKKTWVFRYTFDAERKLITLGEYPVMGLEEARKEAAEAKLKVKKGIDPGTIKKIEKAERQASPTFEELVSEFWDRELSKQKSGADRRRLLLKDVVPVWGRLKVKDIKRRHIVVLLDEIEKRSKSTRNHVHGVLGRLFNFAAERGVIEDSPCTRIKKPKEESRSRVLSDKEIKLVWAALDPSNKKIDMYVITKLALRMILLTGQRPGEVAGMSLEELTPEGFWTIPAERMKGSEAHTVPLCPLALETIERARSFSGDCPFVFRSSYKENAPVTRAALSRAVVRHWKAMGLKEAFTPHDLRRTLRTRLAELGIDDIVAEKVIGHRLQGMLAVYNRHSYDMEKRHTLELWERKLRSILEIDAPVVAKIIPMGR
ncbi:MAG: tyrosine-type recombinase/integrase [Thermodesulfobacteriota bacterium]|nr:MAG: tyrosine-type recombinase/integrase [Thermodesulfobacteriota bacterium]